MNAKINHGRESTQNLGPNHLLSLEFRCEENSNSRRKLCERFWNLFDQNSDIDRVMTKGSDRKSKKMSKASTTALRTPCSDLKGFIDQHVNRSVIMGMKSDMNVCLVGTYSQESVKDRLCTDLSKFDATVVPEVTIPPRIPPYTRPEKGLDPFE